MEIYKIVYYCVGVLVVLSLVYKFWPREGQWGINFSKVSCPKCGNPLPLFRRPKNKTQMMWGGWTCDKCGCEVDKYGKERSEQG